MDLCIDKICGIDRFLYSMNTSQGIDTTRSEK